MSCSMVTERNLFQLSGSLSASFADSPVRPLKMFKNLAKILFYFRVSLHGTISFADMSNLVEMKILCVDDFLRGPTRSKSPLIIH